VVSLEDLLNPPDCQDEMTARIRAMGGDVYEGVKRLPDGSYAVLMRLAFTHAIALGVDVMGYSTRFCFEDRTAILHEWENLHTKHDEVKGWIARRPKLE
jgi:hypothetical protein